MKYFWALLLVLILPTTTTLAGPFCRLLLVERVFEKTIIVKGEPRELLIMRPQAKKRAPVVLYFHGTNAPVDLHRPEDAPYGLYNESLFLRSLSDAGYVIVAPKARTIVPYMISSAVLAWQANVPPYSYHFERSRDFDLAESLLHKLPDLVDHPVDLENVFLAGFSSGGYMVSRLVQYPSFAQKVRGVIVHSASYGECLGSQCYIPSDLPEWHPPTLLVANEDDAIVPFQTVDRYKKTLIRNQIPVYTLFSDDGNHSWREDHGPEIIKWLREMKRR